MKIKSFVMRSPVSGYLNTGWGNGYVCLPPEHPCFKMDYDTIHNQFDIDVHGGLTFSDPAEELDSSWAIPEGCEGYWIVGFDTAHYSDTPERWTREAVEKEAQRLAEQFENILTLQSK